MSMKRSGSFAWRLALALLLVLSLPALAQRLPAPPPAATAPKPAAPTAKVGAAADRGKLPSPAKYGVFLGSTRIGQMSTKFERTTFEGKPVIRIGSDMSMKIEALGEIEQK